MRRSLSFALSILSLTACSAASSLAEDAGGTDAGGADAAADAPMLDAGGDVDGGTDGGTVVGSPCGSAADCSMLSGATCATSEIDHMALATLPGGYCTRACTFPDDGGCPAGSVCGFGFACSRTCTTDADCRVSEGYTCMPNPHGASSICLTPAAGTGG